MPYVPPYLGEMLLATKNGVGVYTSPSTTAQRSQTNSEHDHQQRNYIAGEPIGERVDDLIYPSPDGGSFLKVRNWIWTVIGEDLFGLGGINFKEYHENYVNVDDEPSGWIRESYQALDTTLSELKTKTAEIETAIKGFPGVPLPTKVEKHINANGTVSWIITFQNGYTVDFDDFVKLTPESKLTLTTREPNKPVVPKTGLTDGTGTGDSDTKSTLFTTTNYLIAGGIVLLFSVLLFVLLRKKK